VSAASRRVPSATARPSGSIAAVGATWVGCRTGTVVDAAGGGGGAVVGVVPTGELAANVSGTRRSRDRSVLALWSVRVTMAHRTWRQSSVRCSAGRSITAWRSIVPENVPPAPNGVAPFWAP
jgi:hypothetical protein